MRPLALFCALFRKIPVSAKLFARNSGARNGCANFIWAPGKIAFFLQENRHAHKIPRFRGGGILLFWGGSADFIFMGVLRTCVCALLRSFQSFACFYVRPRLEQPRLGNAESLGKT